MSVGFIPTLSAQFQGKRGLIFACERSTGVLVVFELDHRFILLEPFQTYKGKFARLPYFNRMDARRYCRMRDVQCSMCGAA
jgi:hypothetical protein